MTAAQFREIALSFPEAVEAAHMGHPDFRVAGRIFATLGYQNEGRGVLLLSPEEQQEIIGQYPKMFEPGPGGCLVTTEETQQGFVPSVGRFLLRGGLLKWHQRWLEGLAKVAAA